MFACGPAPSHVSVPNYVSNALANAFWPTPSDFSDPVVFANALRPLIFGAYDFVNFHALNKRRRSEPLRSCSCEVEVACRKFPSSRLFLVGFCAWVCYNHYNDRYNDYNVLRGLGRNLAQVLPGMWFMFWQKPGSGFGRNLVHVFAGTLVQIFAGMFFKKLSLFFRLAGHYFFARWLGGFTLFRI